MSSSQKLASVTNTLKRKSETDAASNGVPKKLKTLAKQRTMTVESATEFVKTYHLTNRKQAEKNVRDQQKRVRDLKKELKQAEANVVTAKDARDALGKKLDEATAMQKSDVERILEQVKSRNYGDLVSFGADVVQDVLAVSQDEADLINLATCIGDSSSGALQQGVLNALLCMKEPPVEAIKSLYAKVLENGVKASTEVFPTIVTVIGRFGSENDAESFVSTVLAKFEQMSQEKEPSYSSYSTYRLKKCAIIDLLLPTWQAVHQASNMVASAKVLEDACKSALLASVNAVEAPSNYSMPKEAAIAAKFKYPELERMLLSPTETCISLNLSKAGRHEVHDLIRCMEYGKLSDDSEGSGRNRVLVIKKKSAPTAQEIQARKERKEKHRELLQTMMNAGESM